MQELAVIAKKIEYRELAVLRRTNPHASGQLSVQEEMNLVMPRPLTFIFVARLIEIQLQECHQTVTTVVP